MAYRCANNDVALGGLFLQSPLASAVRVVWSTWWTLPIDIFANCDKIGSLKCPIALLHGKQDEVVPFWHSELLQQRAPSHLLKSTVFLEGGHHNDIEMSFHKAWLDTLRRFVQHDADELNVD
jgi:fermentation-respiration switch protein FrsA (DUF1100 family)